MRQSNLTYYLPTRVDLLAGVARAAIERQLKEVNAILGASSPRAAAKVIASVAARHENTRVIMALAQAADQEPALRELFRELADGIILRQRLNRDGSRSRAGCSAHCHRQVNE